MSFGRLLLLFTNVPPDETIQICLDKVYSSSDPPTLHLIHLWLGFHLLMRTQAFTAEYRNTFHLFEAALIAGELVCDIVFYCLLSLLTWQCSWPLL